MADDETESATPSTRSRGHKSEGYLLCIDNAVSQRPLTCLSFLNKVFAVYERMTLLFLTKLRHMTQLFLPFKECNLN